MSINKKLSETGWFYHAPAKPKGPQEAPGPAPPPPSQIPGLSGDQPGPPEDEPRMYIKESDSAYVRLAKMGGREDLLRQRTPKPKSKEAKGYPRVDWYYHDDIVAEDSNNNAPPEGEYEFLLPDYMVHDSNTKGSEPGYLPNRLPYAADKVSCYDRDGVDPTDKTVKLPEVRQQGYGIRSDKPASNKSHQAVPRTQMCKPPSPQVGPMPSKYKPMPVKPEDQACMGKILSFGYLDDWQRDRERWDEKQRVQNPDAAYTGPSERVQSEYQDNVAAAANKGWSKSKVPLKPIPRESSGRSAGMSGKQDEEADKPDIFKLSKFKKVAARTDSHRRQKADPNMPQAVHIQAGAN